MCLNNTRFPVLIYGCTEGIKVQEKGVKTYKEFLSQDCTAALKVSGPSLTLWLVHPCTHTDFSFYPISLLNWVSEERQPWEMTSLTACSHENKLCFSWPRHIFWVLLKGFDRWLYLTKRIKVKDRPNAEARLFHCFMCLFMRVCCTTSPP